MGLDQRTGFSLDELRNIAHRHIMEDGYVPVYIVPIIAHRLWLKIDRFRPVIPERVD